MRVLQVGYDTWLHSAKCGFITRGCGEDLHGGRLTLRIVLPNVANLGKIKQQMRREQYSSSSASPHARQLRYCHSPRRRRARYQDSSRISKQLFVHASITEMVCACCSAIASRLLLGGRDSPHAARCRSSISDVLSSPSPLLSSLYPLIYSL